MELKWLMAIRRLINLSEETDLRKQLRIGPTLGPRQDISDTADSHPEINKIMRDENDESLI